MEKMELDILLKQSLTPDSQPEEGLKQTILERMEKEDVSEKIRSLETLKKWRKRSMLPKVAAVVLAILVVGTGTVYAAGRKFNQVYVHKYGVSTISEDQYDENFERDEREMEIIEYPGEIISEEMGGPDDKWISKSVSKLKEKNSGTYVGTLTKYMYPDYLMAVNNTKMESIFHTIPGEAYQVSYEEEERDGTTTCRRLTASFYYHHGSVMVQQMPCEGFGFVRIRVTPVDEFGDSSAQYLLETKNERKYTSKSGVEYTLVDMGNGVNERLGIQETIVLISYNNGNVLITFLSISEQDIYDVLDMIDL